MKIKIELEVEAGEVPLATELLNTLRQLTEHIQGAAPPTLAVRQPEPAPAPEPAIPTKEVLQSLIAQLGNLAQQESITAEVSRVLASDTREPGQVVEDFVDAFIKVVFDESLISENYNVAPFLQVLPALPAPYSQDVKNKLISKILKHLTKARPVDTPREGFYLQAVAFAVLVVMNITPLDGALQTINRLLSKTETRSAAITMLGKTVELCHARIPTACSPGTLQKLYSTLNTVTEPTLAYDVTWIKQHLFTAQPQLEAPPVPVPVAQPAPASVPLPVPVPVPQPAAAAIAQPPAPKGPQQLALVGSFPGQGGTTFAMCYDGARGSLVTAGSEAPLLVWSQTGEVMHMIDMPRLYVCSMDIAVQHNLMLVCAIPPNPAPGLVPHVALYDTSQNWAPRGQISRAGVTLFSCLRCLPDADAFVTGETLQGADASAYQEQVCYYDASRAGPGASPVHVYSEHTNLVTCLAPVPGHPDLFLSGSRDMSIKLWDRRMATSVGAFGTSDPTTYEVRAHGDMVTCLDVADGLLLSTSWDKTLAAWDLRSMAASPQHHAGPLAQVNVDGEGIVKVAASSSPSPGMAAVGTVAGLYTVDYSQLQAPVVLPVLTPDGQARQYNDMRWAPSQGLLYAAGEGSRIDLFQPR